MALTCTRGCGGWAHVQAPGCDVGVPEQGLAMSVASVITVPSFEATQLPPPGFSSWVPDFFRILSFNYVFDF